MMYIQVTNVHFSLLFQVPIQEDVMHSINKIESNI